jgi:hypothetical protein
MSNVVQTKKIPPKRDLKKARKKPPTGEAMEQLLAPLPKVSVHSAKQSHNNPLIRR